MKVIIAKETLQSISTRLVPNLISMADAVRPIQSFFGLGYIPSNEEIVKDSNLDFSEVPVKSKALKFSTTDKDVVVEINDEYVKTVAAHVGDFYSSITAPIVDIAKAASPLPAILKKFQADSMEIDKEWLAPIKIDKAASESV